MYFRASMVHHLTFLYSIQVGKSISLCTTIDNIPIIEVIGNIKYPLFYFALCTTYTTFAPK